MLPSIQIYENTYTKVMLFWDLTTGGVESFHLFWSPTGLAGSFVLLRPNIPNYGIFGKRYTSCTFYRADIGLTEKDPFYVAISSEIGGVVSPMGPYRIIPHIVDQTVEVSSDNSPLANAENHSQVVGAVPVRVVFTQDIKLIEVFNNSATEVLYIELSGFDADPLRSMPIYPLVYYTAFTNLAMQTGFSVVSGGGVADARIVVHY